MKNVKDIGKRSEDFRACSMVYLILGALIGELIIFFLLFPYPIGRALIAILLQPLLITGLLMGDITSHPLAPREFPPEEVPEGEKKLKKMLRRLRFQIRPLRFKLENFLSCHRLICVSILAVAAEAIMQFWFWKNYKPFFQHPTSVYIPVVLGVGFFLLLGLDIWCGHLKKDMGESRYGVLLGNIRHHILLTKFLFLAGAAVAAMPMLNLPRIYRQYYYVLCVYFALQSVAIVGFYCIRAAKQELITYPDLRALVLHRKKGDLNLLGYLEDNTGMTMRSLWSISLIKKLLPYSVLVMAALLWLCTGIVQIAPSQQGALYRLGRLQEDSLKPGLHMIFPWPIDCVDVYDTESLKEITIGYTTDQEKGDNLWTETHGGDENKLLLGGGNELVSINLRLEFKIQDLCSYLKCSNSPESLLESAAYEAITARTIGSNLESLLALDRVAFSDSFQQELVQRISRYDTGLQLVDVVLESIHPPVEVAEIYQQIISAGIDAEKIILDAQAQAAVAMEDAYKSFDTNVNTAQASSYKNIADANASVAEFMASVDADSAYGPDYRYYKYLEAVKKAYADSTLIIVGDGIDSSHLYLGQLPF